MQKYVLLMDMRCLQQTQMRARLRLRAKEIYLGISTIQRALTRSQRRHGSSLIYEKKHSGSQTSNASIACWRDTKRRCGNRYTKREKSSRMKANVSSKECQGKRRRRKWCWCWCWLSDLHTVVTKLCQELKALRAEYWIHKDRLYKLEVNCPYNIVVRSHIKVSIHARVLIARTYQKRR